MTLEAKDFEAITDSAIKAFDERVASVNPDICWEFNIEVSRLESQVIQLYGIAALLAKREQDLAKIAEIWGSMIGVCDMVAGKIRELCSEHPYCSASHDKILDIRNKCQRLSDLHS